jgi:hypothetical protein
MDSAFSGSRGKIAVIRHEKMTRETGLDLSDRGAR